VKRDIRWRLHLAAPPSRVYGFVATDAGRARYWVERSEERDGVVHLRFPDGTDLYAPILERKPPSRYALRYFGGSEARFELRPDGRGGTDLDFFELDVPDEHWSDNRAGWLSVLLGLKAACDFGVDLRNHDPGRQWDQGYVDN
jgi:hypothetical protein